jgi:hypothetical protein
LADLVQAVKAAAANNQQAHAIGSDWSFKDCGATGGLLIFTNNLTKELSLPALKSALKPNAPANLIYLEAGMRIREAYQTLQERKQAFETLGGQSGQTLAGAISTGTHGPDFRVGPLPDSTLAPAVADSVLAMHLVGPGGVEYWIEPSAGITDPALLVKNVVPSIDAANVIYDDTVFNACLVALGCFGVIYSYVLRVRQAYDLIEVGTASTWEAFAADPRAWFGKSGIRSLQVAVCPYPGPDGSHYCLISTRTEGPPTNAVNRPQGDMTAAIADLLTALFISSLKGKGVVMWWTANVAPSGDQNDIKLAKLAEYILENAPELQPILASRYTNFMNVLLPSGSFRGLAHSVMDAGYGSAVVTSKPCYSIECFFPGVTPPGAKGFADFVNLAISEFASNNATMLVGYISLRFTGKTRALLGEQQWSPTCAVEISALMPIANIVPTLNGLVNAAYRFGGIPHWGQVSDVGIQGNRHLYSQSDAWLFAFRRVFQTGPTPWMFQNDLASRWQLFDPSPQGSLALTIARTDSTWDGDLTWVDVAASAIQGDVGMVAATSSQPGELQLLFGDIEGGSLYHVMRKPDKAWAAVLDVWQQVNGWPGSASTSFAATSSDPLDIQALVACQDGGLWRVGRQADGSWTGREDAWTKIARPAGFVTSVAAASSGPGVAQFLFCSSDGGLWHTIRNSADGTWSGTGDVWGKVQRPASNVVAVAAASASPGEAQFLFCTADGHLWHTLRDNLGKWSGLGDVNGQVSVPWPVVKVCAADAGNGVARFLIATNEGSLWMTDRNPTTGAWSPIVQVNSTYLRISGAVCWIGAARDGAPGTTSVAFVI